MWQNITVTDINALLGIIFGFSGFVLGLLAFFRDKPKVKVTLQWGMQMFGDQRVKPGEEFGFVSVTNVGRRPIYVSHVAIKMPKGFDFSYLVLQEGIREYHTIKRENSQAYFNKWIAAATIVLAISTFADLTIKYMS